MAAISQKTRRRDARAHRTRTKIRAVGGSYPRLSVFRSNKHLYAQIIDDRSGKTLLSVSDFDITKKPKTGMELAAAIGKMVAEKAIAAKISRVVFDRGSYAYHGRVKALADAARENKLQF